MFNKYFATIINIICLTCLLLAINPISTSAAPRNAYNPVIVLNPNNQTPTRQIQSSSPIHTFVLLIHNDISQLAQVQSVIQTKGGRVTHLFPHQALIAQIPAEVQVQLSTLPGVALVDTQVINLAAVDIYGPQARRYASVWNNLLAPQAETGGIITAMAGEHPDGPHQDTFIAPDLPPKDDLNAAATSVTPGYYQTSEYMAGSVAVGIVLVESDGRVDPSSEDWTADEKQQVFSEIVAACHWWATLEPRAKLSFVYDDHFSNPLPTGVEPITHPYYQQKEWIKDAMNALGYNAGSYFRQVRDYNNALRETHQTDWAFTIFVVDSSADSDNRFSDGYFAYAYLGGPFTVMTYGNNGYGPGNMDAIAAHEMGHIFLALDQYYSAYQPCTRRAGYLDVENQNSEYGACVSNVASIMRGQTYPYLVRAIDSYAAGQLGWRDSDGDNILDPLDTALPVTINNISQNGNEIAVTGSTEIIPYPSPQRTSVTINTLTGVRYRFNGGAWQLAAAADGVFDSVAENYYFTALLSPGLYRLEVAATDSAGNESDVYAIETIVILDPLDGGLNTQLYLPNQPLPAGVPLTFNGVAYHGGEGIVTNVQYRLDAAPWQTAYAQDGAFDSNFEEFSLTIASLEVGMHRLEVFATDGEGNIEVNSASLEFQISAAPLKQLFLPLLVK
ncbi:MAG: hypothetical protein JW953_10345 [Anaerolineae bacterium]|nr:hypothetical protein [Anaerolineae bacterium]